MFNQYISEYVSRTKHGIDNKNIVLKDISTKKFRMSTMMYPPSRCISCMANQRIGIQSRRSISIQNQYNTHDYNPISYHAYRRFQYCFPVSDDNDCSSRKERGKMKFKGNGNLARISGKMISRLGLYAIEDKIIDSVISNAKNFVKNRFCTQIKLTNLSDIAIITDVIKRYDKNFSRHIDNGHDPKADPIISSQYLLKIRPDIFVFVNGIHDTSEKAGRIDSRTLILTVFGDGQHRFVKYINNKIKEKRSDTFLIYNITADRDGYWSCSSSPASSRSFETLYFDDGIAEEIKHHLEDWKSNEALFTKRGLIYKTGILLHGTHGTGKSSIASAIANYLGFNLISINSSDFGKINISDVVDSINCDTDRYVILLDEIDTIYTDRDDEDITDEQKNTTAKLLTFLDSVSSPNNCVIVATTNYIDKLGADLKRNGRFDKILKIDDFNRSTAIRMCHGFGLNESDTHLILDSFGDTPVYNPAKLQGAILSHIQKGETIEGAV